MREYAWPVVIAFCLSLLFLSWFGTVSFVLFQLHGSFSLITGGSPSCFRSSGFSARPGRSEAPENGGRMRDAPPRV